jgi:hypothetical protein
MYPTTPDFYARYGVPINEIYPYLALRISGKISTLFIAKHYRWGNRFCKIYSPVPPKTFYQTLWWDYFYQGIQAWHAFSEPQRHEYRSIVKSKKMRMYGINLWLRYFLRAQNWPYD